MQTKPIKINQTLTKEQMSVSNRSNECVQRETCGFQGQNTADGTCTTECKRQSHWSLSLNQIARLSNGCQYITT